ncbi:MAG: hypothetical protein E7309_05510 [Butyrivibrio sp.]|nr:hypothetical protein [Butyrivibrio sp.]
MLSYDLKNAPLRMRTRAIGKCCINATALGARMSQATFFVQAMGAEWFSQHSHSLNKIIKNKLMLKY